MESNTDVWVVIPAYNEEPMIARVIDSVREFFPNIVCVDDASSDDTACAARAAGALVIPHPVNLGQGAALQTGFTWVLKRTEARFAITFDADGQHRAADAEGMCAFARKNDLGFVLGSRFLGKSPRGLSPMRRLVLKSAAAAARRKTGLAVTDAHNGLRVIRRDALFSFSLVHNRMAHASEIVEKLAATGLAWAEYPVSIEYSEYSRAKGQSLLNSVNILVDLVME